MKEADMDATQAPSQSHFSFTRFSEKIRDSAKRSHSQSRNTSSDTTHSHSHSHSHGLMQNPGHRGHAYNKSSLSVPDPDHLSQSSLDTHPHDPSRDRRRSSVANYTSHLRSLFHPSPHPATPPSHPTPLLTLPTELLSKILSHLPFYTLLHARRTSRLFASLIPGADPLLAEQLYLRPSRGLQIYDMVPATFDFDVDVEPRSVEHGVQPRGARFSRGVSKQVSLTRRTLGLIRTSEEIVFHPVIVDFNAFVGTRWFCSSAPPPQQRGRGRGEAEGPAERARQSWRDMLVSMPPLREIRITHARTRSVISLIRVGDEGEGITLGMVFDALGEWGRE